MKVNLKRNYKKLEMKKMIYKRSFQELIRNFKSKEQLILIFRPSENKKSTNKAKLWENQKMRYRYIKKSLKFRKI